MIGRSRHGQVVVSAPPGARRGDAMRATGLPTGARPSSAGSTTTASASAPQSGLERRTDRTGGTVLSSEIITEKRTDADGRRENPPVCCCFFFTPVSCCHATPQAAPVSGGVVKSAIRESTIQLQSNVRTWTWDSCQATGLH